MIKYDNDLRCQLLSGWKLLNWTNERKIQKWERRQNWCKCYHTCVREAIRIKTSSVQICHTNIKKITIYITEKSYFWKTILAQIPLLNTRVQFFDYPLPWPQFHLYFLKASICKHSPRLIFSVFLYFMFYHYEYDVLSLWIWCI